MLDPETNRTAQAPAAEQPAPAADPVQELSPRRRSALVTYLAILFAVAFLFVAVTMGIEARRLKNVNQELQDSSQKTSASLTGNINALQAENERLRTEREELNEKLAALEQRLSAAETARDEAQAEAARQQAAAADLETEKQTLSEQLQELPALRKQLSDAITVSELLQRAVVLSDEGDLEGLQRLLDQIEALEELLSPAEKDIYEELKIA